MQLLYMSLRRWIASGEASSDQRAMVEASRCVEQVTEVQLEASQKGRKRKFSERHHYDQSTRTAIGKYALINGNKRAVEKFSASLGFSVSEATVRNFKRAVQSLLSNGESLCSIEVPERKQGRPLLLPEEIDQTKKFIQSLRASGSPVSLSIVLAAAKGIVTHKAPNLLKEYGGQVELKKSWAFSFLSRHNYVKRKATRTSRKVPNDFDDIKASFLDRINEAVKAHNISPSMIINFDQTGTKMVDWTLEVQGTKQIDMVGLDDKRVFLAETLSGELLPPEIIYAGKTPRCHPNVNVPCNTL